MAVGIKDESFEELEGPTEEKIWELFSCQCPPKLSQVKLRLPGCLKDPPKSPNPSKHGLSNETPTPFSHHRSSAEGAGTSEGAAETQGELSYVEVPVEGSSFVELVPVGSSHDMEAG